jgi:hypothetical protein
LLARQISQLLILARDPKVVNGPEVLDKYVGTASEKIIEISLPIGGEGGGYPTPLQSQFTKPLNLPHNTRRKEIKVNFTASMIQMQLPDDADQ